MPTRVRRCYNAHIIEQISRQGHHSLARMFCDVVIETTCTLNYKHLYILAYYSVEIFNLFSKSLWLLAIRLFCVCDCGFIAT